jgi:hypothetical protein
MRSPPNIPRNFSACFSSANMNMKALAAAKTPYARDGRRQFALVVEFPQRAEILIDALLLLDATKCGCVCSAPRRMRRLDATGSAARRLF